ncbi:MAG: peptidoglycan-binding protein [Kiloniellaceae bacterium]
MGPEKMGPEKALAPDPATIVFGSNRPIVAAPPKLPAGSGLQFSGSSAGLLKASGPQPTSPKASGLTFSSASKPVASAKPVAPARPAAAKPASVVKDPAGKPTAATAKAPETKPDDGKKPVLTKPAIAPQASGRHFDRERSTGGFLAMLLVLTVAVGGLAFWMKLGGETPPEAEAPAQQVAIAPAAPETTTAPEFAAENAPEPMPGAATEAETAVVFEPSIRAPESPGPLAGGDSAAGGLSTAEIGEVQELLSRLNLDPGSLVGVLTEETAAAIRSYQEMAGLPADGTADHALLEELRSVVELYGG